VVLKICNNIRALIKQKLKYKASVLSECRKMLLISLQMSFIIHWKKSKFVQAQL